MPVEPSLTKVTKGSHCRPWKLNNIFKAIRLRALLYIHDPVSIETYLVAT